MQVLLPPIGQKEKSDSTRSVVHRLQRAQKECFDWSVPELESSERLIGEDISGSKKCE